ncbi:MAG: hypothetical protein LBV50_11245 [Novosphingobium sp.]|jgi:hypothetical protein|nr:hypothetical protein [Novosphingobium sp.]
MTRVLLALLALLGLAVQAAPAEAAANCGVGSTEIGALSASHSQAHAVDALVVRFVGPALPDADFPQTSLVPMPRQGGVRIPTVLMGVDRARE